MTDLTSRSKSPIAYLWHYVSLRPVSHAAILCAVCAAVACSVSTQYGVKMLVDSLTTRASSPWTAFAVLVSLIAADNMFWRIASLIAIRQNILSAAISETRTAKAVQGEEARVVNESTSILTPYCVLTEQATAAHTAHRMAA